MTSYFELGNHITKKLRNAALETICITMLSSNISCISPLLGDVEPPPTAPVPTGLNITGWHKDEFDKKDAKAIDKIASDNYSGLTITPCYYQNNSVSNTIDGTPSMSFEFIRHLKEYASSKSLRITLKPIIDARSNSPRTYFMPKDIDRWFSDYTNIYLNLLNSTADSSQSIDINIGTELDSILTKYPKYFNKLIDTLRASKFNGRITYSVAFSSVMDTTKISQANMLNVDYIGIDFYVSMHKFNTVKQGIRVVVDADGKIVGKESYAINEGPYEVMYYLDKIMSSAKKPVKFTEVGYRSVMHGNRWPFFEANTGGVSDRWVQRLCYENFLDAMELASMQRMNIIGVDFWITDRPDFVQSITDADSIGYSPFGKQAEHVVKEYNKKISHPR